MEYDEYLPRAPQFYLDIVSVLGRERNDEALRQAREQLTIGKENSDKVAQIAAMRLITKAQLAKNDTWNGMKTAGEVVDLAKTAGDKKTIAEATHMFAKGQLKAKELDKALATAQEAQAAFAALKARDGIAAAMTTVAAVYAAKKDAEKAMEFTNQALEIFKELDLPKGSASVLKVVADLKVAEDRYYHASLAVEDMINYYNKASDYEGEALSNLFAAEINSAQGDLQGAVDRSSAAVELFDMMNNDKKKAAAVLVMAKAFQQAGQQQDAVQAAEVCLTLFQNGRDRKGQASALLTLADIYLGMQQHGNAASKYEEACFMFRQLKDKRAEAKAMAALASAQVQSISHLPHDLPQAIKNAARAVELFGDGSIECGNAMITHATALFESKEYDDALAKASEAQQLFEASKDMSGQANALIVLGNVYFGKDNKEAAIEAMEKARDIAEEIGDGSSVKKASQRIKDIGRYKKKKPSAADTPILDVEMAFDGSNKIIEFFGYEGRAMRTGAPASSSSKELVDGKDFSGPQRQKVLYNLRMQHVPNVDLSVAAITA